MDASSICSSGRNRIHFPMRHFAHWSEDMWVRKQLLLLLSTYYCRVVEVVVVQLDLTSGLNNNEILPPHRLTFSTATAAIDIVTEVTSRTCSTSWIHFDWSWMVRPTTNKTQLEQCQLLIEMNENKSSTGWNSGHSSLARLLGLSGAPEILFAL